MGGTLSEEQKAPYCQRMVQLFWFESTYWTTTLDIIMAFAATLWLFLFFQILKRKHLQTHPAPIIAALCLSESFFAYMNVSRYLVCKGGHAEGIIATTIFWDSSEQSQLRAMNAVSSFYTTAMWSAFCMNTLLDITLQVDLVIILSEPFAPINKR